MFLVSIENILQGTMVKALRAWQ